MKQRILVALVVLFSVFTVQSQVSFRPGFRAGVNFSHFTQGDNFNNGYYDFDGNYIETEEANFTSKTDFYVGFIGELKLSRFYTLQPEINYTRQGSKVETIDFNSIRHEREINVSYLSVGIINKLTFGSKFNFHVGPTFDIIVDKPRDFGNDYDEYYSGGVTEVDIAFLAGFGVNITKAFAIEARVKKGVIPVLDYYDMSNTNVVFSVGAAYTFDIKEAK